MGTDVYLEWDKMPKRIKEKRNFGINEGGKGYLRASIGMERENKVIFAFFESAGEGIFKDYVSFDFVSHYQLALKLALAYILDMVGLIELPKTERQEHSEMSLKAIKQTLSKIKSEDESFEFDCYSTNFRDSIMWLESFLEFVELGVNLQKEGKNPKVYVSY